MQSDTFSLLEPMLFLLNVKSLVRIKANLVTKKDIVYEYGMHSDQTFDCSAAVFYLNTNNGHTNIGGEKIASIENRLIKFNALTEHSGSSSTDSQIRVVLNINYFE